MLTVTVLMLVGIFLGLKVVPERFQKANGRLQLVLIALLIFCMGVGLGSNPDFFSSLAKVGIQAVLFAVLPAAGSAVCVYFATKYWMKGADENDSSGSH